MRVHDEDRSETWRRSAQLNRDGHDLDGQAATRAAVAGHVHTVEHGALLRLQRVAGNAGVGRLVDAEHDREPVERSPVLDVVGKGGGAPLPEGIRGEMETGLGADFSSVRVHDDGSSAASAQAVNAKAYTVGNDVVFNRGAYQPETPEGRHTLAHELTHVVQQRSGPVSGTATGDGVSISDPNDSFEREAEATATTLGHREDSALSTSAGTVQRQEAPEEEDVGAQAMSLQRDEEEAEDEAPAAQTMSLQRDEEPEEDEAPTAQPMPLQRDDEPEEEVAQ